MDGFCDGVVHGLIYGEGGRAACLNLKWRGGSELEAKGRRMVEGRCQQGWPAGF
jgi:hypothetical protein